MFFVPYRKIQIETAFNADEAIERISQAVDEESVRRNAFRNKDKYFRGSISREEFRLVPADRRRNSYAPSIHGVLVPGGKGTLVNVTFSGLLSLISLAVVLLLGLFSAYSRHSNLFKPMIFALVTLVAFHSYSYYVEFLPEVRASESLLRDLLGDYR